MFSVAVKYSEVVYFLIFFKQIVLKIDFL